MAVEYTGNPSIEPKISQSVVTEENEIRTRIKARDSDLQPSCEDYRAENELSNQTRVTEVLDKGFLQYGYGIVA